LPSQHRHIDIGRIKFDRKAAAASHFCGDDGRSRAAESARMG
jgi:hypothetical protein